MNIIETIQENFATFLHKTFDLPQTEAHDYTFELNVEEAKQQFGDLTSNAALILAKKLKRNPREIAQEIADSF